jgi:hypothetical protein
LKSQLEKDAGEIGYNKMNIENEKKMTINFENMKYVEKQ